jgi:hypothetical protein
MRSTSDGLIIKERASGESDKLLTVLTADRGKILICAKGVRSLKSKNASICRPFTYANLEYYEKNGMFWLASGEVKEHFLTLGTPLEALSLAAYIADVADELSGENFSDTTLLRLLLNTFFAIENSLRPYPLIKGAFEFFAAAHAGFAPDLSSYLFGNILTIAMPDLLFLGIVALLTTLFFALYIRPIIAIAFDREFAASQGIRVRLFEYLLMMLIALCIVGCLRLVGIVLVISLLTIPQLTANLFTHSFTRIIWLSIGIGYLSCLGGFLLSYYLNVPSGASIIFFSIIIYAVCKLFKTFRVHLRQKNNK